MNTVSGNITIINKLLKPKPSRIYSTYWKFAFERQSIFFKRLNNNPYPWSDDLIFRHYKFTNVYRACDRVSQYLIKNVIYNGASSIQDIFFRIVLYKLFNKIETWEYLEGSFDSISYNSFSVDRYSEALGLAKASGKKIYSGAYIMASPTKLSTSNSKHHNHLMLIEKMMKDNLVDSIINSKNLNGIYQLLLNYPSIGEFLAFQLAIDINYSTLSNFCEMDFVKAGPGAKDGIFKCFDSLGDFTFEDVIKMMADTQIDEFNRFGLDFSNLWGRDLQLIDCQNIFCEVSKYTRVAYPEVTGLSKRSRIKQVFKPNFYNPIDYFFPPKWNLNHQN